MPTPTPPSADWASEVPLHPVGGGAGPTAQRRRDDRRFDLESSGAEECARPTHGAGARQRVRRDPPLKRPGGGYRWRWWRLLLRRRSEGGDLAARAAGGQPRPAW